MRNTAKYLVDVACSNCGKTFLRNKHELKRRGKTLREKRHYCSDECRIKGFSGESSPSWKGGKVYGTQGYIGLKVSPTDFFFPMADHHGYILEHRLVMAKHLNRCLLPWEIVHHKNSIKSDNKLGNLELLPSQIKHFAINMLKKDNRKLRARVDTLEQEMRLLKWQIKELNGVKYEPQRL